MIVINSFNTFYALYCISTHSKMTLHYCGLHLERSSTPAVMVGLAQPAMTRRSLHKQPSAQLPGLSKTYNLQHMYIVHHLQCRLPHTGAWAS